jgi:hypothetical protein
MHPCAGDEHLRRLVDPDLLDQRIVEIGLQRAKSRYRVEDRSRRRPRVGQRRQHPRDAALVVVGDDLIHQPTYDRWLFGRVDATTAHELPDLVLHHRDRIHDPPPVLVSGAQTTTHRAARL